MTLLFLKDNIFIKNKYNKMFNKFFFTTQSLLISSIFFYKEIYTFFFFVIFIVFILNIKNFNKCFFELFYFFVNGLFFAYLYFFALMNIKESIIILFTVSAFYWLAVNVLFISLFWLINKFFQTFSNKKK